MTWPHLTVATFEAERAEHFQGEVRNRGLIGAMVRFNLDQLVLEPEPHAAAQQDVSMDVMHHNDMELSIFQPSLSLELQPTRQNGNEPLLARSHALSCPTLALRYPTRVSLFAHSGYPQRFASMRIPGSCGKSAAHRQPCTLLCRALGPLAACQNLHRLQELLLAFSQRTATPDIRSRGRSMDMHRPISRRMQGSPRTEFLPSSEGTMHDAFRSRTMDMGIVKQRAPPVREAPRPTPPSYPAKPEVPLDEEACGNDMGIFLGRCVPPTLTEGPSRRF